MFHYFRNCSSNPNHVCCGDSPTKGVYNLFSDRLPCSWLKVTTAFQTWQMFNLYHNSHISDSIVALAFTLGMTVDLCMSYLLMLVSMTLTLMQGHSGSAKAKIQYWFILKTKQAKSIKLATTVGHFYVIMTLKTIIWLAWPACFYINSLLGIAIIMPSRWLRWSLGSYLTGSLSKDRYR